MKQFTFAEINDMENGMPIPSFTGTVKKVFEQKTDHGQYGQWWLQNVILQDEHANEITVTWCCSDPWDGNDIGKLLLFESGRDKKDQLAGIKKEIRNKNGKHYESVKVDDRAKVKVLSGVQPQQQRDPKGGAIGADWPERTSTAPQSPPQIQNGEDVVKATREHLMQVANLYNLCVDAVDKAVAPWMPEVAHTSEQFQASVASLFIEASSRRTTDGVHWWSYVDCMPTAPIKKREPEKPF